MSSVRLNDIKTDVLVVGAGAAGLIAAISAARGGANTTLVEYNGFLGGISSTLPWLGFHDRDYRQIVKGLPHKIVQKLHNEGHATNYIYDPKCSSLVSVDSHSWKCLAMQLASSAGVKIMLQTHMTDTIREGDRIKGIVVEHKSGRQNIYANITVDCSGDGDVAARGGVGWEKGRIGDGLVQAPTLVFKIGGVDRNRFVAACQNLSLNYREWLAPFPDLWKKMQSNLNHTEAFVLGGFAGLMEKARRDGKLSVPQTRVVGVKLHRPDQIQVVMTRVLGLNPIDVDSLSDAYTKVYAQIPELVTFFKEYVPGCEDSYLLEIAPMLGVRESRRIIGDYILNADDLLNGTIFSDAVAMGGYHIDIHRPSGSWVESKNVRSYSIPLRSLIAAKVEGLLMAGKCLSATHEAVASTRVIPICMAQGEAVGTAAALASRMNKTVRDLPITLLQDQLNRQGVEFGQSVGQPNYEIIEQIGQLPFDEPPTTGDNDEVSSSSVYWVK